MSKRREAGSCSLKVRYTTSEARSTKAYATSTGANSTCDLPATMEPTALETATTEVTATTKSTTAAAVPSRQCYGTQRHRCNTYYQTN
jgi:hypothetical protein